ncbi:HNH endonuclease signature motif containing protein [Catellatospora citrea]|uniref:HNH endonuclease signature motif containing protein n=1 Tax=Catellatospora citrea TaxID=53366 RepID=UPI0033C92392
MIANVTGLAKHFTPETLRTHLLSGAERTASGCLEYRGYGKDRLAYQKLNQRAWAHIAAYAVFVGDIDPELVIDHLCNNPPCIEPTHLRQVTPQENYRRRRGTSSRPCGHPRQVDPESGRLLRCNPCNAEAQKRWRTRTPTEAARHDLTRNALRTESAPTEPGPVQMVLEFDTGLVGDLSEDPGSLPACHQPDAL